MKIVIVTPLYPPDIGRPSEYVKGLAERAKGSFDVTVMTYGSIPEEVPGVRISAAHKDWPIPLRMVEFTFRLWKETHQANALWVCDGASIGLPSVIVGKLRGIPILRYVLMDEAREREAQSRTGTDGKISSGARLKVKTVRALQDFVLKQAYRVCVPTASHEFGLVKIESSRVDELPFPSEGLQIAPFPPEKHPCEMLTFAWCLKPDDVRTLVLALKEAASVQPELHLTIMSEAPWKDEAIKFAQGSGVADKIRFLGYVSRVETAFLLRSSGLFFLGQGDSDLHREVAMAFEAGIPIVATESDDHKEMIMHGTSGLLVPPGDVRASAMAIERLIEDAALRDGLIEGGKQELKTKFSWDAHIEAFRRLVENVQ